MEEPDVLVTRFRQGEDHLLENICLSYKKLIYNKAHNSKRALFLYEFEDIVQEYFSTLVYCIQRFDTNSSNKFISYLYMCLNNRYIELLRKQQQLRPNHIKLSYLDSRLEEDEKTMLANVIGRDADYTNCFLLDYADAIDYGLMTFRKNRKDMIHYYLKHGGDYENIAKMHGVKYDAVYMAIKDFRKHVLYYLEYTKVIDTIPFTLSGYKF